MKIIDLTHLIEPNMPVFPGTEPPIFEPANTLEVDGFIENKITMYSHTGTHLDAPSHMLEQGSSLDSVDINNFIGRAILVDVRNVSNSEITEKDLVEYEQAISQSDFVLLHTGWSKKWGTPEYFDACPTLTQSAVNWLAQFKLKGIGIDAISVDHISSSDFPIHHTLFSRGLIVVENLANLDLIGVNQFMFSCLPLKIKAGDGSPVRAIAMIKY